MAGRMDSICTTPMDVKEPSQDIRYLMNQDELLGSWVVLIQSPDDLKKLDPEDGCSSLNHGQEPRHEAAHGKLNCQL